MGGYGAHYTVLRTPSFRAIIALSSAVLSSIVKSATDEVNMMGITKELFPCHLGNDCSTMMLRPVSKPLRPCKKLRMRVSPSPTSK